MRRSPGSPTVTRPTASVYSCPGPPWPENSAYAENLIKRHKSQLASDRTSCRCANANYMRLILHTAAYWLLWRVQQAVPKANALASAEFTTLRLRLIKVAARIIETTSRTRVAFASACTDANTFKAVAAALIPTPG